MAKKKSGPDTAADIYLQLPGLDCGEGSPCGLPKCMLFADALVRDTRNVYACPYLEEEKRQQVILLLEDYFS